MQINSLIDHNHGALYQAQELPSGREAKQHVQMIIVTGPVHTTQHKMIHCCMSQISLVLTHDTTQHNLHMMHAQCLAYALLHKPTFTWVDVSTTQLEHVHA
jgi:hypothetical protein